MASRYTECEHCHTRTLLARGVPALNYGQDPAGQIAVTITTPRTARWLKPGETAGPLEHRHSVHACDGTRRAGQRDAWKAAQSAQRAAQRRHRPTAPDVLPGLRIDPGRQT